MSVSVATNVKTRNGRSFRVSPLDAALLFRMRARSYARVDWLIVAAKAAIKPLYRLRDDLAFPLRYRLARDKTASVSLSDSVVKSVSVLEAGPAAVVTDDGEVIQKRGTVLVVQTERGIRFDQHADPRMPHICPSCKPQAVAPHYIRFCKAHA